LEWVAETGPGFKLMSPHKRRSRDGNNLLGLKQMRGGLRKNDSGMNVRPPCSAVAVVQRARGCCEQGVWNARQRMERRRRRSADECMG